LAPPTISRARRRPLQLGFVIDQTRCIGCHACTVACKSENHVPVGNFRTWVKYTEQGAFPAVKRSFAVLRCNQCTAAPCVTICPVNALEKGANGVVDVDPKACIGCKSCMQGCPYDALYLNEAKGTAEKCHFCAHRVEQGLAPACAIVCPTEAIIPGDFDDPESRVSRLKREYGLAARKLEAGTGPNVLYREVAPAGIDPQATSGAGGYLWADRVASAQQAAERFLRDYIPVEESPVARTTYDVDHKPYWGWKITAYLVTKSVAAGAFLASFLWAQSPFRGGGSFEARTALAVPLLALAFLTLTSALLVVDLKRPERFLYILLRPNWSSWLVRGTWFLIAYGGLLTLWTALGFLGGLENALARNLLGGLTALAAGLSACYTGWLFGQAKGRVLWMRRGLWAHLVVQAVVAGAALLILADAALGLADGLRASAVSTLLVALALHAAFVIAEGKLAPKKREAEYALAHALVAHGPFARKHWIVGVLAGILVPIALLMLPGPPALPALAAALALVGLWTEEDVLVRAGQALPIS
jgi:Fe-S-cluster-containing dehydrogenase component/formate-dependent nitrite reductase membrane component NrfD